MSNTAFIAFFAVYLVAMVILAFKGMKKTTDTASFSLAKGQGPLVVAITFAATFMSASTFLGLPGQLYETGFSGLWFHAGQWFPCIITLAIMAKAYQKLSGRLQSLSLPDWLGKRYNSSFLRFWTAIVSILFVVQVGSQLAGVGTVFNNMIGIPYEVGVLIGAAVVMFYLVLGGSYSHVYTNVVQGSLMCLASLAIFISGFLVFGNIFSEVPAKLEVMDPALVQPISESVVNYGSVAAIVGIFITHGWWTMNPQLMNKIQYLKSEKDIKKFVLLSGLFIFMGALVLNTGLYTRALVGDSLTAIDDAVPTYLSLVFPKVAAAFLSVVILAAVMSTTDGIMVYLSTVLGHTLYHETYIAHCRKKGKQIDKEKAERVSFNICRYGILLIGLIGIPIAINRPASLSTLLWVGNGGILGALVGPTFMGLFCKRTSKQAAIIGSIAGFCSFMIVYFGGFIEAVYLANAVGGAVSLAVTALFTFVLPPNNDETVKALFED